MLRVERQSARMSKITNDGLTRSGTGYFTGCDNSWRQRVNSPSLRDVIEMNASFRHTGAAAAVL